MRYDYSQDLANELLEKADQEIEELKARIANLERSSLWRVHGLIGYLEQEINGDCRVRLGAWGDMQFIEVVVDWDDMHCRYVIDKDVLSRIEEKTALDDITAFFKSKRAEKYF